MTPPAPDPDTGSERRLPPLALLLPLLLAAQPVATDSYLPALPGIRADLGNASASLTVFVLAFGFGQLPSGPLSDRFGRRPVLLGGLALYALAALGAALAADVPLLVLCRALQGLAMGAIMVCARAAVRDVYTAIEGAHALARGLTGLGIVALAAPLIGALVVQTAGWRWVFVGMALYAMLLLGLCASRFAETRANVVQREAPAARASVREIFTSRSFWAWGLLAVSTYGGLFCFLLLSPAVYISYLGLSPAQYAWIPAAGSVVYIVSTSYCRRLLARFGPVRTVQFGALLSLGGALIQVAGCWFAPLAIWPLLLGHGVYTLGHGIHQPCGQAGAVADLPNVAGRAVAWSGFVMMVVAFAAGQSAAQFIDDASSHGAWPMVAPLALAACALFAIAFGWLPRLHTALHEPTGELKKDSAK